MRDRAYQLHYSKHVVCGCDDAGITACTTRTEGVTNYPEAAACLPSCRAFLRDHDRRLRTLLGCGAAGGTEGGMAASGRPSVLCTVLERR